MAALPPGFDPAAATEGLAHGCGFADVAALLVEVERRAALNARSVDRLTELLDAHPGLAYRRMAPWTDHPIGVTPLAYIAMLRFDAPRLGLTGPLPGTGVVAQLLLDRGAALEGDAVDRETPLMTAASYGDAEVAAVLIAAGASLDAVAAPDAGGVPGGTALRHAEVFGMPEVAEVIRAGRLRS